MEHLCHLITMVFNRPGVAGAVLQTASWLNDKLIIIGNYQTRCSRSWSTNSLVIHYLSHSVMVCGIIPPDIHNIINPRPLELDSWNFERMFTPYHVSCVTCHVSRVICQKYFFFTFSLYKKIKKNLILHHKKYCKKWWSYSVEGLLSTGPTPSSLALGSPKTKVFTSHSIVCIFSDFFYHQHQPFQL